MVTKTDEKVPTKEEPGSISGLTDKFLAEFNGAMELDKYEDVRNLAHILHHSDLADLLQSLNSERRERLIELLRADLNPDMIAELDNVILEELTEQLSAKELAEALVGMDTDDAVNVVEELGKGEQKEVLNALPNDERILIEEGLSYPEDSAGRLMQRGAVSVPIHWNVGQAIDFLRSEDKLPRDFFDIFTINSQDILIGSIPLSRIMRTHRHVALKAIIVADMKIVPVDMDQEDVAFLFRQRDLISAPVVNDKGCLVGVITVDDIVDVIDEEHEEDIMRLAGVGEGDDLYNAIISTTRSRCFWLLIHLCAALIAAYVISLFKGTLEEMVVLAILMPIVATMGGAASVQALTVAVRAISMKELTSGNAFRTIGKEIVVGLLNGLIFAAVIGSISWYWFDNPALGGVIALAMVINLLVAGLSGSSLPILLERMGFDPAVASSAFLTSITDVVGFYVFLGLASVLLL